MVGEYTKMNGINILKASVVLGFLLLLPYVNVEAGEHKSLGIPRTQIVPIQDTKSNRQYDLYIKLPEDYEKNTDQKYPVIYMTDGDYQMDLLSGTTEFLMPNAILVGISWEKDSEGNETRGSRLRDYTLIEYETIEGPTGEASNYLSFIRGNIIKHVESNFRTKANERAYLGYSSGAEFGAYTLLAEPDTFQYYLLGSPALDKLSTKYLDELEAETAQKQKALNTNVFLSIAEQERPGRLDLTKDFVTVLKRRTEAGLSLTGLTIIQGDHSSAVPETFLRGIKWLSQKISE